MQVDQDKLGSSNYFWAFPSKSFRARENKLEESKKGGLNTMYFCKYNGAVIVTYSLWKLSSWTLFTAHDKPCCFLVHRYLFIISESINFLIYFNWIYFFIFLFIYLLFIYLFIYWLIRKLIN